MPRRRIRSSDNPNPPTPLTENEPFADEVPAAPVPPKRRPCTASIWLSPSGFLVVQFPFDQPMVDVLRGWPKAERRWDASDQVWRVVPERLDDLRAALGERFEVVEVHPDCLPFVERRARAVRRSTVSKVVADAERAEGEATVYQMTFGRGRDGGGAA